MPALLYQRDIFFAQIKFKFHTPSSPSLFGKQRFDVPCAVIDMEHLNSIWNRAVKDQVVIEPGHAPGADIAELGILSRRAGP